MNGLELVTHLRESILDDYVEPYLWSTTELLRFINAAEAQVTRRAYVLIDGVNAQDQGTSGTAGTAGGGVADLCTLTITPNVGTYTLSRLVLRVKRVKLATMTDPLIHVTMDELDSTLSDWQAASGTAGTAGTAGGDSAVYPSYFISELGNSLTLVRTPTINDTASLVVARLPLMQFGLTGTPEIHEKYHLDMLDWAAHLAYMKNDSDTMNINLAAYYEKSFTDRFGPLPDAYTDRMRRETPVNRQIMRPRSFF